MRKQRIISDFAVHAVCVLWLVSLIVCSVAFYGFGYRDGATHAKQSATHAARGAVEREMRNACVTWFTDNRRSTKAGSPVLCRAPAFLLAKDDNEQP